MDEHRQYAMKVLSFHLSSPVWSTGSSLQSKLKAIISSVSIFDEFLRSKKTQESAILGFIKRERSLTEATEVEETY